MTVKLLLKPEVEAVLAAQAQERGVSLESYLDQVLQNIATDRGEQVSSPEAEASLSERESAGLGRENLAQFLLDSPFAASDLDLARHQDYGRPVEL